ncbi:bifunctional nuclease family protein [Nesterenkonia alba]|uniref:bifunctional nuclease family protein n=1 Tax=Nesterenkonia alba TaxID=515814 RepID=UPI0003B4C424|nr:bifunctional nuclease family protein [Nesterenkonia alba]
MEHQVELEVVGVRVELPSNQPVLILRGAEPEAAEYHVAVVVGPAEAAAVARALQGEIPPRPMTHDLLTSVLEDLGGGVASVEIGLHDESTYSGTIRLASGKEVDARASDAVAVAVRAECSLTMDRATLEMVSITPQYSAEGNQAAPVSPEAQHVAARGPISEEEIEEFHRFLDQAGPEDFDRQ